MLKSSQEVGLTIKELRIKKGLTQDQLAAQIQLTPQAVSKWENGDSYPDLQIIGLLADIFEVSTDELINVTKQKEAKQQYRIYERIENDRCIIEIKNVTANSPCEITLSIRNKTNQKISLKPDNFVFLREDGGSINPKKRDIMDQYDEEVVNIKLLHEIPSFVPSQVNIEVKLVYEAIYEVNYLWIDITDIISSVSYIIRKSTIQTNQSFHSPAKLTRDELIDYYNYHHMKGENPRPSENFPKISMDILNDLIIPKDPKFISDHSYLFDQEVLTQATINDGFVDFNFAKQHITDPLVLREVVKKNWDKIDEDCTKLKCYIIKYSEPQEFMDQEIIERIIVLRAKYAKDYRKWTLNYITEDNIARIKPELIRLNVSENLQLFNSHLSNNTVNKIICESQIVELPPYKIETFIKFYKEKLSQISIDKMLSSINIDSLETLKRLKPYASEEFFNTVKDKYFEKEQEKLNTIKDEV